jgi:MFS family permease
MWGETMIISWVLSKVDKDTKENIAFGLVVGLAFGLVVGLVAGLAFGLVVGLVAGLAFGLAFGLVAGLFPFDVLFILAVLAIIEILYWFDKKKKSTKDNKWWFVIERKLEAATETGLGLGTIAYFKVMQDNWKAISDTLGTVGYYAFMFLGVVGVIGIWLWLNGLKYREKSKKKGG